MDIKQLLAFCSTKNERLYTFHAPVGAPLGELYYATFEILNEITKYIQETAKKAAPKELSSAESQDNSVKE